jgi:hypothetical protein
MDWRLDRLALAGSLVAACWLLLAAAPIPSSRITFLSSQTTEPVITWKQDPFLSIPRLPVRKEELKISSAASTSPSRADFWATLRSWLPSVAALGVFVSILTYLFNNRKERLLRFEDKVAENIGVLVTFPGDESVTLGKAYNSLRNLHALGQVAGRRARLGLEDRVADALARIVSFDLDLNDRRKARFDALALDHWPPYSRLLSANTEMHRGIFYRYVDAFHSLLLLSPENFKVVSLDADKKYCFPSPISDRDLQHFATLVAGYKRHVELTPDPEERELRIKNFGLALENQLLSTQVFNDMKSLLPMTYYG